MKICAVYMCVCVAFRRVRTVCEYSGDKHKVDIVAI